jgi:dephospho-CoA kinase
MLKKIAVTGGIACGKTTVCQVFQELGAYVVSADQIAHQLLNSRHIFEKVVALLGNEVVDAGTIDRKKVAAKVFYNPNLLQQLETLMHPAIFTSIDTEYERAQKKKAPLFVAEIPLLFETGNDEAFDETVVVLAPEKKCIERFSKIGFNRGEYKARMKNRLPTSITKKKADHIVQNSGSLEDLQIKAKKLFYKIQK